MGSRQWLTVWYPVCARERGGFAVLHVVWLVILAMLMMDWPAALIVWWMPSCLWWNRDFLCVCDHGPCDLLLGGNLTTENSRLAFSHLFFHVTHLQPPHLSIISSTCASSCSPHGMAHVCLTAAPPAPLNLSFLPFAVLSLFSFILRCQRKQDHHSVGDWPQVQRAEGLAPRSVCSRPQCPVDGVCVCACMSVWLV